MSRPNTTFSKRQERQRVQQDIARFLAQGGRIREYPSTARAKPRRTLQ
ncbi:hypothetical protein [Alloalcanivorax xenomutans]